MGIRDIWFQNKVLGINLFHDLSNSISSIFVSVEIGNDKFNYIVPEYFKISRENIEIKDGLIIFEISLSKLIIIEDSFINIQSIQITWANKKKQSYILNQKIYLLEINLLDLKEFEEKKINIKAKNEQNNFQDKFDPILSEQNHNYNFAYDLHNNLKIKNKIQEKNERLQIGLERSDTIEQISKKITNFELEVKELCATIMCKILRFFKYLTSLQDKQLDYEIIKFLINHILKNKIEVRSTA